MQRHRYRIEHVIDEDRGYRGSGFSHVIHFNHPTWHDDPNDPSTATRVKERSAPRSRGTR